jgi:hypothetical protein
MTWKVTNSQDYAPKYVRYLINTEAVTPGTVDYDFGILAGTVDIDWGDGTSNTGVNTNTTHTYSSPGYYVVTISQNGTSTFRPDIGLQEISVEHESVEGGGFWDNSMVSAANGASNLKRWGSVDLGNVTSFQSAWQLCSSLTSFPALNSSNVTNFGNAWISCSSLTSFPLIDTSSGTNFGGAWRKCTRLASFPAIDTSLGTNFQLTWEQNAFSTFPALNFSSATLMGRAWTGCSNLTEFPALSAAQRFSSAMVSGSAPYGGFQGTWGSCTRLTTFPPNIFDDVINCTRFTEAFTGCALTAQSIENILVSIDTANTSNGTLGLDGGTNAGQSTWTAAATTAYNNLIARGWTISARP